MRWPWKRRSVEDRQDYGSERLPTDVKQNPWDTPSVPGEVPPSQRVAGDGEQGHGMEIDARGLHFRISFPLSKRSGDDSPSSHPGTVE